MDDDELGPQLHNFLTYYAWDLLVLSVVIIWHVLFIIVSGIVAAFYLMNNMKSMITDAGNTDVDIEFGFKYLLFGMMMGSVNWIAGQALSINKETILKLTSFTPLADSEVETSHCLLYTSPSPRDKRQSRMPSSA